MKTSWLSHHLVSWLHHQQWQKLAHFTVIVTQGKRHHHWVHWAIHATTHHTAAVHHHQRQDIADFAVGAL